MEWTLSYLFKVMTGSNFGKALQHDVVNQHDIVDHISQVLIWVVA